MRNSLIAKQAIRLVGVVIFIYILLQIDIESMLEVSLDINPVVTAILILFVVPIMFLKGARWQTIGRGIGLHFKTVEAVDAMCIAQMTSLALPGSVGDFVRVPYLTARGNSTERAILSLLIDAAVASIIPYIVAVVSLIYVLEIDVTLLTLAIPFLWIAGGYLIYRIIKATIWPWFIEARVEQLLDRGFRGSFFFDLPKVLNSIGKKRLLTALTFSGLSWLVYTTQGYVLALALGFPISWEYMSISLSISFMLTAIPITVVGLGIREGVLLFMFGLIGIDPVSTIAFSLTLMLVSLAPSLWGLISWANDPFVDIDSLTSEARSRKIAVDSLVED